MNPTWQTIFLALGSNLGDRAENLRLALEALPPRVRVTRSSPVYETEPWGYTDQPCFLNQVIEAETRLEPLALLRRLKKIELGVGRQPSFRYGPRQIDLDILFYGDLVCASATLEIPHPRLAQRAFVLVPLADLAPDLVHPVLGQTVAELLAQVDTQPVHPYEQPRSSPE